MANVKRKLKTAISKEKTEMEIFLEEMQAKIPDNYNQIELAQFLFDDEIDWLISISNRTDGKSFNYINFCVELSIEYGVGFMLLGRTYWLRNAFTTFLSEIFERTGKDVSKLLFKSAEDYVIIYYQGKIIGCIADLNNASDLKLASNFLKKFPIIIYDEFLAIESDYLPDEWIKLKTIYQSVDRGEPIPFIGTPKIMLLGNAVNFSSPLLAELDIFNILENHPINTMKKYGYIALEMRRNDNANERVNMRAFQTDDDPMTQAKFDINNFAISNEKLNNAMLSRSKDFNIKIGAYEFLNVSYDPENQLDPIISFSTKADSYLFCIDLRDKKDGVILLDDKWQSENFYKKYDKNQFKFKNAFSKNRLVSDNLLVRIKMFKCIGYHNYTTPSDDLNTKTEKVYKIKAEEQIKRNLFKKFMA